MSTIKVNTIQSNTTATLDVNSPVPSLDVTGSVSVGENINASGIITATSFSGNVSATGVSTFTTLSATSIVGVSTLGVTTAYVNTLSGISTIDASSDIFINRSLKFASGYGIDFSATANSSGTMTGELLSDYEEGIWTPRISGTSGGNYTAGAGNLGRYSKVGQIVTASATVHWTAAVTPYSGALILTGLPYTALNVTGYRAAGSIPGQSVGIYASGSFNTLKAGVDWSNSFVYIVMANETITTGINYSHNPNVLSSGDLYGFTITYLTN